MSIPICFIALPALWFVVEKYLGRSLVYGSLIAVKLVSFPDPVFKENSNHCEGRRALALHQSG